MHHDLEVDFGYQKKKLSLLRSQRAGMKNGSDTASLWDSNIAETESLILSYETLRYYEHP
jgi:hypothetical protein